MSEIKDIRAELFPTDETPGHKPEVKFALSVGGFATVAPFVADLADASAAWGVIGGVTAVAGAAGAGMACTGRLAKDGAGMGLAATSLGVGAWGGYTAWVGLWPGAIGLSSLAIGALATIVSALAARAMVWKRQGSPMERAGMTVDVRLAQAKERALLSRLGALPGGDHDPDHDPTQVLPPVPWAGPAEGDALDTVEIAPGVFVPVTEHILIGGATGGGKSGILNILACSLLGRRHSEVSAIDMKPGAPEFGIYRRAGVAVVSEPADALETLQRYESEMDWRGAEMERMTRETGRKHADWVPTAEHPHLFLLIDELTEMLAVLGDAGKAVFYKLLRLARAFAITLIAATQSPRAKMFGADAGASGRGQFGVRICLATKLASETRLILDDLAHEDGWKDAHRMPKQGHFLIDAPGYSKPEIRRAFFASDDQVSEYVARRGALESGRGAASIEAAGGTQKAAQATWAGSPDEEPMAFAPRPQTAVQEPSRTNAERITDYLTEHGSGTGAEMAEALGMDRTVVNATTARMRKAGTVVAGPDGRQRLAHTDADVVEMWARR